MAPLKLLLITNSSYRHKFIAHSLANKCNLSGIVIESKTNVITAAPPHANFKRLDNIIEWHNQERFRYEFEYFGNYNAFPKKPLSLKVEQGSLNSNVTFEFISQINPDFILLFGSSIVKSPILNKWENRIINLHLGLSPYYRGSATNLFPLADGIPECVGATFHMAVKKIDAGNIIHQIRPTIFPNDNVHSIGNRVIMQAGDVYGDVVNLFVESVISSSAQDLSASKLVNASDVSDEVLLKLYENFDSGFIDDYLEHYESRISQYPIINNI